MKPTYQKLNEKLMLYKKIYKHLIETGYSETELDYLKYDIYQLVSKIKSIDKSIGMSTVNCLSGNYKSSIRFDYIFISKVILSISAIILSILLILKG